MILQTLLTILSYVFVGGISSIVTIGAIRRKGNAEASDMEEQAEAKSIQNDKDKLDFYNNLINDMTNRLNQMLTRVGEAEHKYEELRKVNWDLQRKYSELEIKYSELEKKYNELVKH